MNRCGHITPHWVLAMRSLKKVDRKRKQSDQLCGVVTDQILHTNQDLNPDSLPDQFPVTLEIRTTAKRSLDFGDPIELKLHLDLKRLERRITPKALDRLKVQAERALSEPVYLDCALPTESDLTEPLADHLATWSNFNENNPPPGELSHLATVRTYSDTDPPHATVPNFGNFNLDLVQIGYGQAIRALVTPYT